MINLISFSIVMSDQYTPVQRFHLAQLWEQHHSVVAVQRTYARLFNLGRHDPRPKRETILDAYDTAITLGLAQKPQVARCGQCAQS